MVIEIISFFVIRPLSCRSSWFDCYFKGCTLAASGPDRAVKGNEQAVDPTPEGPDV